MSFTKAGLLLVGLLACGESVVLYRDAGGDAHVDASAPLADLPATPDAAKPPHDVTPVCADDAAGCNDPPTGNTPPNRNQ